MRNKRNIRTCLGCCIKKDKKELFRIASVKTKNNKLDNNIVFDEDQQYGGRGAYICSLDCFEKAIQNKLLQSRIKSKISINKIDEIRKAINERIAVGK